MLSLERGAIRSEIHLPTADMPWSSRLKKPVELANGRVLKTLGDARDIILALPEQDRRLPQWQSLAGLLSGASQSTNAKLISIASDRLRDALTAFGVVEKKRRPRR
jgi:hypothetical protein